MNKKYITDLQVAEDLENLARIIHESIEYAESTLEKAKEIHEVRALIAEISFSRKALLEAQETVKQVENTAITQLEQAQNVQESLQELEALPDKLTNLGITESVLQTIQTILDNANTVKLDIEKSINDAQTILQESKIFLNESQELIEQAEIIKEEVSVKSNDIALKIKYLEEMVNFSSHKTNEAQQILQEFSVVIDKIGGITQVKHLLKEVQNTHLSLKRSEEQLLLVKQNLFAINTLEDYLNNFQNIHNRRQLWKLLWKELGFVGIIVYLLSLITPRRKIS